MALRPGRDGPIASGTSLSGQRCTWPAAHPRSTPTTCGLRGPAFGCRPDLGRIRSRRACRQAVCPQAPLVLTRTFVLRGRTRTALEPNGSPGGRTHAPVPEGTHRRWPSAVVWCGVTTSGRRRASSSRREAAEPRPETGRSGERTVSSQPRRAMGTGHRRRRSRPFASQEP